MADIGEAGDARMSDRVTDRVQFALIFSATFVVLAAASLGALLLPWTWSRRFGPHDKKWFIGRAWEDAGTFTELSFMG